MKHAMKVWAEAPPMAEVYVTPHLAHSGAVYVAYGSHLAESGHAKPGIHVQSEDQRAAILGWEGAA